MQNFWYYFNLFISPPNGQGGFGADKGVETRNASKQAQKPEKRSKRAIKQYGNKTCTADDICRA